MNHLKLRTVLITALALGAAYASLAAPGSAYEPPTGRNGWQRAAAAKALPQTAAVRAPAGGAPHEPPTGRNGWQPATTVKSLPLSATAKTGLLSANGR